jgi:predicted dehydrogenase
MLTALKLSGGKLLLTVARFSAQKDHATLIAAMPVIVAAHPDAVLLLVGTGEAQDAARHLVETLGMAAQIRFLGQRDDIADLMAAADLFVLPSRFEGLPLAVLEAMAAGLAVVATRIGGTLEALGKDHPHLTAPGDAAGLAQNIIALLHDPPALQALGDAGRQRFSKHFQAERMAAETEAIYRPFLHSDGRQGNSLMDRTRIGFIGVGGIAHRHLDILAGFDDVELVAFADPDFSRAEDAARQFGAHAYDHHRAMLEAEALDAVYICIPPFAHGEAERDVIAKNIPFFVEKPVSLDIELADELAALIAQKNLITGVGYHWRYLDTVEEARQILAGNPAQLLSGYWLDQTPPPRWWWKTDGSGGQMVEQTTHIIDLARYLVGDVSRVYGMASHKPREHFPDLDVPTASTASLNFASGAIGNIGSTCLLGWGHHVGLNIFADGLAIELTDHDIMVDVGAGRPMRRVEGDPVWHEDRDFIDAVRGGENRIRCPYHEAVETHRVALAVNQSAQSGQSISFAKA